MTKGSGMGDQLYVAGRNLSGDTNSLSRIGGGPAARIMTGIDMSAQERIGDKRDGGIVWNSYFNKAASAAHLTLSPLPTNDVHIMYGRGTTLGNPAACMVSKQVNYDGNRDNEGGFLFSLNAVANKYGLEWGRFLTAGQRSDTVATNGTSVDMLVGSTLFGAQAYLQVFSFTGTSCTVSIQSSTDNGSGDAFATVSGLTFTAATGVTSERVTTTTSTTTVERYLRVVTTGTFSQCTFAVMVNRNDTATVF